MINILIIYIDHNYDQYLNHVYILIIVMINILIIYIVIDILIIHIDHNCDQYLNPVCTASSATVVSSSR